MDEHSQKTKASHQSAEILAYVYRTAKQKLEEEQRQKEERKAAEDLDVQT